MLNKAVFINVGFDPTATLEVVSALTLSTGDLLVVVYPKSEDGTSKLRSEQARAQIKAHLEALKSLGRRINYKELELDLADISGSIGMLIDVLAETAKNGYRVYLELTGGVRAITVLMTVLSHWMPELIDEITMINETTRERLHLPVISPMLLNDKTSWQVLKAIATKGSVRRRELSDELGVSESSVSRSVSKLKRLGLIKEEVRVLSLNERIKPLTELFSRLII